MDAGYFASVQTAEDQSGKWALTDMPALPGVSSATNYSQSGRIYMGNYTEL